jgi:hypothetical protein
MGVIHRPGWQATLPVGPRIFDFYRSRGDLVSAAAVNIPSVQDGPGVVVRYGNLTLNHVLTTTNRCRSLTVLVDGNLVINSGGGISMTARGARGSSLMGLYDGYIPNSIKLASSTISLQDVLSYIRLNNIDIIDRWFWDDWAKIVGVSATFSQSGEITLLSAAGCGAGVALAGVYGSWAAGPAGNAGTNGGTGSGGSGGGYGNGSASATATAISGPGCPWGAGVGSGAAYMNTPPKSVDQWGGRGGISYQANYGGAGNPSGSDVGTSNGTGGILKVIVRGTTTINSGGIIQADGMPGESNVGGASGGGHVSMITLGGRTINGTVRANGGAATTYGGPGGAGSVVVKTWAEMGWAA